MAWLDPQWFTREALAAEWQRKDMWRWMIGVVTTVVVLVLFCHPDTAFTALTIDSIGIDGFLVLLELQLLVGVALFREQAAAVVRSAYTGDRLAGAVMRKAVALPRYLREALRGSFQEDG